MIFQINTLLLYVLSCHIGKSVGNLYTRDAKHERLEKTMSTVTDHYRRAFVWEYSGTRIYSGFSAPGSRIAGLEIQVFWNRKRSQTNANLHYSNYSYSGLIPNERALRMTFETSLSKSVRQTKRTTPRGVAN